MDTFSNLTFFTLLIKSGTLAAAAQEMGITPPSVSKRLAALEQRLGVRLLHRTTRRISLTPEGEIYVGEARVSWPTWTRSNAVSRAQRRCREAKSN